MNNNTPGQSSPMMNILNSLPGPKKLEMQNLLSRLKAGQIELQEFLTQTKNLLGNRLYSEWIIANKVASNSTPPLQFPSRQPTPASSSNIIRPPSAPGAFLAPLHQNATATSSMPSLSNLDQPQSNQSQQDDELLSPEEARLSSNSQGGFGAGASQGGADEGVDVTRMDTASLQDVIQYSGIDLKEEAENILKGHEAFFLQSSSQASSSAAVSLMREDLRSSYEYYLNMVHLKERISKHCKRLGLKAFHDDCMYIVAFAMRERVAKTIEAAHVASKHRTEYHRLRFKIKIENDPLKQVWVLQKHFKDLYPAKEQPQIPSALPLGSQQTAGIQSNSPGPSSMHSPVDSNVLDASRAAKKAKKAPNAGGSSSKGGGSSSQSSKDREDLAIKTKLANVTANLALGIQQKSWMSGAAAVSGSSNSLGSTSASMMGIAHSSSSALGAGSLGKGTNTWKSNIPLPFIASSTEKDIANLIASRTISVQDLLFAMESDEYLCRSTTYFTVLDSGK